MNPLLSERRAEGWRVCSCGDGVSGRLSISEAHANVQMHGNDLLLASRHQNVEYLHVLRRQGGKGGAEEQSIRARLGWRDPGACSLDPSLQTRSQAAAGQAVQLQTTLFIDFWGVHLVTSHTQITLPGTQSCEPRRENCHYFNIHPGVLLSSQSLFSHVPESDRSVGL